MPSIFRSCSAVHDSEIYRINIVKLYCNLHQARCAQGSMLNVLRAQCSMEIDFDYASHVSLRVVRVMRVFHCFSSLNAFYSMLVYKLSNIISL